MARLRLNCHIVNLTASLKISFPYQAIYYYLLDNPVSGPLFVPTVIAALHPSNKLWAPFALTSFGTLKLSQLMERT